MYNRMCLLPCLALALTNASTGRGVRSPAVAPASNDVVFHDDADSAQAALPFVETESLVEP